MDIVRYNHLNNYLKSKFGSRVLKVCIDGGFTCPNRDGRVGTGGCIFCSKMGAGDLIKYRQEEVLHSIFSQISGFLNSYRGERADKFIAYFQNFTSTYDTLDNLRAKYNCALNSSEKFVGLEVATRPDCIDDSVAKLLSSYQSNYYVCVELGLQTASDEIGRRINRCYTTTDFVKACNLLHNYDIPVVAHLMVGLPNETIEDILSTVDVINSCGCSGVKIHSTYILRDTMLEKMYRNGEYTPITQEYYVECVAKIINKLNKDIIIHRISGDPPREEFVAPDWVTHKKRVLNAIDRKLRELNIVQGGNVL